MSSMIEQFHLHTPMDGESNEEYATRVHQMNALVESIAMDPYTRTLKLASHKQANIALFLRNKSMVIAPLTKDEYDSTRQLQDLILDEQPALHFDGFWQGRRSRAESKESREKFYHDETIAILAHAIRWVKKNASFRTTINQNFGSRKSQLPHRSCATSYL